MGSAPSNKGRIDLAGGYRDCNQCGGWLAFELFGRDANKPGGVSSTCRACCYANRCAAEEETWGRVVALLGGSCNDCPESAPTVLQLRPRTPDARAHKGVTRARGRRPSTLARQILAGQRADARRDWGLHCANCAIKARPSGRMARL